MSNDEIVTLSSIQTWTQGYFVDTSKYENWTVAEKARAHNQENHLVRPFPTAANCYPTSSATA